MIEDAPIFYPTLAEFKKGPISYIAKIRSQAEKYGICKIVPPKSFRPPFAVDENCFQFTPRTQRLNELEASIRTKLNYTEFGFTLSPKRYTLAEFTKMADQFKKEYFKSETTNIPLEDVEKEYWRLVSSLNDDVSVEYGADLHCNEFGSGFPTLATKDLLSEEDLPYIDHPWNLNNTPVAEGSVFKYINANISGMIIPWMYVGMCFSTFCWHNEDHWTYSISYLHHGEPKTWYGVPGSQAEAFERSMKHLAPNLFESQPDLLHQLVTICNPMTLIDDKVPIHKVNQYSGEFVVTFPRAYHTGFNQGLNFAEAVNFAPADWVKLGRNCMQNYASVRRFPVFSHDELICKMVYDPSPLEQNIAIASYQDMLNMCKIERFLRSETLDWGVTQSLRFKFEIYPDDERQCCYCKTTCFLSALCCLCDNKGVINTNNNANINSNSSSSKTITTITTNKNNLNTEHDKYNNTNDGSKIDHQANQNKESHYIANKSIVCLDHRHKLCNQCEPKDHILLFRFTLDELRLMHKRLTKHVNEMAQVAFGRHHAKNEPHDQASNIECITIH